MSQATPEATLVATPEVTLEFFPSHEFNQMFGGIHFIYHTNWSTATEVDSSYLDYGPTAHNVLICVFD